MAKTNFLVKTAKTEKIDKTSFFFFKIDLELFKTYFKLKCGFKSLFVAKFQKTKSFFGIIRNRKKP